MLSRRLAHLSGRREMDEAAIEVDRSAGEKPCALRFGHKCFGQIL